MKHKKRGRLSRYEQKLIAEYIKADTPDEEIAERLNRPVTQINYYVKKFHGRGEDLPAEAPEVAGYLRQLRRSAHWEFLKQQYNESELNYYEGLYAQVMTQFKDDIMATEQLQILHALDAVIIINRQKKARKMVEDQINSLENKIHLEMTNPDYYTDEEAQAKVATWENQKQALLAQSSSRTNEFTNLGKKFEDTLAKLKSTREQRIKNIESSLQSWTSLIKILQDRKVREKEGRTMELVKFATNEAAKALQKPHKYKNGDVDQPLLVPENVLVSEDIKDDSI